MLTIHPGWRIFYRVFVRTFDLLLAVGQHILPVRIPIKAEIIQGANDGG